MPRTLPSPTTGPWVRGMVNTVADESIPLNGLADARDVDIDRDGHALARPAFTAVDVANGYSALFEHNGVHYAVSQGLVGVLNASSFDTFASVEGTVGWTTVDGAPVYCDSNGIYKVVNNVATQYVVRQEVDCEDRYGFATIPGGRAVAHWKGRLLVLRGKSLIWSEALDYGSYSPPRNFIRFRTTPTWMAPLDGGIFVGLRDSVMFVRGTNPSDFVVDDVAGAPSPYGAVVTDTRNMSEDIPEGVVAIWFSDVGFVVGLQDGSVLYPQAENLRGLPQVARKLAVIDDRVYAFAIEG